MDKAHVAALETRHAGLEKRIEAETRRPLPNDFAVTELKKAKLRLKDSIEGV